MLHSRHGCKVSMAIASSRILHESLKENHKSLLAAKAMPFACTMEIPWSKINMIHVQEPPCTVVKAINNHLCEV